MTAGWQLSDILRTRPRSRRRTRVFVEDEHEDDDEEDFQGSRTSRVLCQHLLHNIAGDICQPKLTAHVFVGEACMVKAEAVQDRSLQVVDVDWILDNV